MSFRSCVALAAAALLALAGSAFAQQPIVIKFSHVVALDTPKGKGAEYFKKLAEERTKGRVKVEVYPNSSLFKDGEEMEALQLGSVQMLAPSVAKFGPLGVREFEVFDLPSNFYTQKMHEVQKYLALTDHGVIEYAVIVNKKFWDGLPADIRTALDGAMKDSTKYANDIAKKENDDALEAVRKSGKTQIITLTAD